MTLPYINVHTHYKPNGFECAIFNAGTQLCSETYYSCGIHPWNSNQVQIEDWLNLKHALNHPSCIAIGECGLDALKPKNTLKEQEKIFIQHIQLANQHQKPLILHVVRTHEQVLHLLKKEACSVPVIFHGFNKSYAIYNKILEQGHYISLGVAIQNTNMKSYLHQIDLNYLFFETDDSLLPIQEIYNSFSVYSDVNLEKLKLKIYSNFKKVFNV